MYKIVNLNFCLAPCAPVISIYLAVKPRMGAHLALGPMGPMGPMGTMGPMGPMEPMGPMGTH